MPHLIGDYHTDCTGLILVVTIGHCPVILVGWPTRQSSNHRTRLVLGKKAGSMSTFRKYTLIVRTSGLGAGSIVAFLKHQTHKIGSTASIDGDMIPHGGGVTMGQRRRHWVIIKPKPWLILLPPVLDDHLQLRHCHNVALMLVQRRRRWTNIIPTLDLRYWFLCVLCWANVVYVGLTKNRHWVIAWYLWDGQYQVQLVFYTLVTVWYLCLVQSSSLPLSIFIPLR